ncbi:MAG TPA: molybdopterin-dependent oxidoreductase [Allosphingosinicella sp.]|nr:molybdopterin-dependent oxidoreductase [Allosphingosinicella sp.]
MDDLTQADVSSREAYSFCRICLAHCGMKLTINAANEIVRITGDRDNPLTRGYACIKGLTAGEAQLHPNRLLHASRREADGSLTRIPVEQALDEIASKLRHLIDRDGPDSIALFGGNGAATNSTAPAMQKSFMDAIGSRQYFTALTIDQSAKLVSFGRLGRWGGGSYELEDMDVLLLFGSNPLVSHSAIGTLMYDPVRRLKAAKARGLKLITIDPRFTETAHFADLALQPYPGQDPAVAAGLIRLILAEGWEDGDFCRRFVGEEGMRHLRAAVAPFDPERVEADAGLEAGSLRAVAEMFARDGRCGIAHGATGPNMTPYSNLAQHMIDLLNVVCGRFPRAGHPVGRSNVQGPSIPCVEQVVPPDRMWEGESPSRIRGAGMFYGERLSGTLADEILTPGKDRIRALIVDGGNLALSLPDQKKTMKALSSLDLLVSIDPWITTTSALAHYILPPLLQYERSDLSIDFPGFVFWDGAWVQYTPAIVPPPPGSELVDDWYIFWSLAKRLGTPIDLAGKGLLPFDEALDTDAILAHKLRGAQVSLEEAKPHPHGLYLDLDLGVVQSAPPGDGARFDAMPDDVADELAAYFEQQAGRRQARENGAYPFLMSARRLRDVFNSTGAQLDSIRKRTPYNPAFLNGADMTALGVSEGDLVEVSSAHGQAAFVAARDDKLRPGVVAASHGWGAAPGSNTDPREPGVGACVNLLVDSDDNVEAINAMPHFSAVPVRVRPLAPGN